MKFNSLTVHAGVEPDPSTGAIMTPIYQTSTYVQDKPGVHKGFEYARTQNPTRSALEACLAALENGRYGFCFGSGMAAMDTVIKLLNSGDEVIAGNDMYGGSYRLLTKVFSRLGITSRFVDLSDIDAFKSVISDRTRLVWLETPTNPMLRVYNIEKITSIAHENGIRVCVDNTFASPYLQRPLDLGADIVHHSATKYIAGHSDVIIGALVTRSEEIAEQLGFLQNAVGGIPGPQDCFLTLRGIKTLHLRMERTCENAMAVARFLDDHPKTGRVIYPGLKSHPHHALASEQMKGYGGMVSFDLKDDSIDLAHKVLSGTKLFSLAESLGGVESLIGHPASMTHASIPPPERHKVGLTDSLIRLSLGIEDEEDLTGDLAAALAKV